jgi:hypothetical protein
LIGFSLAAGRPAHDQVIATAPRLLPVDALIDLTN